MIYYFYPPIGGWIYFMPKIRIRIRLSPAEWRKIELVMKNRLNGKNISIKGNDLTSFITTGVHREFSKKNKTPCEEKKMKKVRKYNDISVSDEILNEMECQANQASISVSELVKRRLFDIHLLPSKTIE